MTLIARNIGSTAWPIGNCQGLPSPKSPRMLTSARNGKWPLLIKDSIFLQFPVPLDCISKTPRAPPEIGPGEQRDALLSRQCHRMNLWVGQRAVDQRLMAGIRNIGELGDIVPAQQRIERVVSILFVFGSIHSDISGVSRQKSRQAQASATHKNMVFLILANDPP
jgi:hypothetical protein